MKKIVKKIYNSKTTTLIIGTNDHTSFLDSFFFEKSQKLKNIDYFNYGKNDSSDKIMALSS